MSISTQLKDALNRAVLARINLRLDTLTRENAAAARYRDLERVGLFEHPAFRVLDAFRRADPNPILAQVAAARADLARYESSEKNSVGYTFDNPYYSSPDAEVLNAILRLYKPRLYLEVGSGYSTKIARQTIVDAHLGTQIWSIDPEPRSDIDHLADRVIRSRVEALSTDLFDALGPNDVLFIDSSHKLETGNDVTYLYLHILPALAKGVLVHIHDVFLPYEYPREWVVDHRWAWDEQYLVQVMLEPPSAYEVLWPGYYLQRTMGDFAAHFEHLAGRRAQSLWLRRAA